MKGFTQILDLVPEGALYLTASRRDTDCAHAHYRRQGKRVLVHIARALTEDHLRGCLFSAVVLAPDVRSEHISKACYDYVLPRLRPTDAGA